MAKENSLEQELTQFMKNYELNANQKDFNKVKPFISEDAIFWFSDGSHTGIHQIQKAFEKTWLALKDEIYTISEVKWLDITKNSAICIYKFTSQSTTNGNKSIFYGRGTNVFSKTQDSWKIVHEHLSLEPKK